MSIRMGVTGTAKFRRVAAKLQATAPIVKSEAARELRKASPPVLGAVQAKVRNARFPAEPPVRGGESTGLREHLATSTVFREFGPGVRFVVDDPNGWKMARYTDGRKRSWRHPTFGRRDNPQDWVQQSPDPWFHVTIRARRPVFAGAVERAVRRIVQRLGGS